MPCIVHFSDGTTLKSATTAAELQDAWVTSRGMPILVGVADGPGGVWINPQHVIRFADVPVDA